MLRGSAHCEDPLLLPHQRLGEINHDRPPPGTPRRKISKHNNPRSGTERCKIVTPRLGSFEERTKTEDIDPPPARSPVRSSRDTVRSAYCDCKCDCDCDRCGAEPSFRSQPSIVPYVPYRSSLLSAHHQTCALFACRRRKTISWIRNASPSHQRRETFHIHCTAAFKLEDDKECIKSSN